MEIRELRTKDFFRLVGITAKIGNKATRQIHEGVTEAQAGLILLTAVLEHAEQETLAWFADLANMTPEQFGEAGFNAPLDVIETLIEKEDMKSFFQRVRALLKKYLTKQ